MEQLWSVDRFEGGLAVLIGDDSGDSTVVPRTLLMPETREGDLVRLTDGMYRPDAAATAARREEVRTLEQRLLRR